jgi:hypothetical protein
MAMDECEGIWKELPWSKLRYYPCIGLEELRNNTIIFSWDNKCPSRDFKWIFSKYNSEALPLNQRR